MKTSIRVFLAIGFATVTLGKKCCAPNLWKGLEYRDGSAKKYGGGFTTVTYDADKERIAATGKDINDNAETEYHLIYDYGDKKRYVIHPKKNECEVTPLDFKFPEFCIPDSASQKHALRDKDENVLDVYAYASSSESLSSITVVTKEGCLPITEHKWGTINEASFFEHINYFDVETSNIDTSVFTPPTYCNKTVDRIGDI